MKEGKWIVLSNIDRGSSEILGMLGPLIDSLRPGRWIGASAQLDVPGRGVVRAHPSFAIFATRTVKSEQPLKPTFLGAHRFSQVMLSPPSPEELQTILDTRFPRLAGSPVRAIVNLWQSICALGSIASVPEIGLRHVEQFCLRMNAVIPTSHRFMDVDTQDAPFLRDVLPNSNVCQNVLIEARDVFFGAGAPNTLAQEHLHNIANVVCNHLGIDSERKVEVLNQRTAEVRVEKDGRGRTKRVHAGRVSLIPRELQGPTPPASRPFAMHRPVANLIARIANAVSLSEPVLLSGETGTGKTTAVTHLASLLNRPLTSLNLSNQTEASDLIGGFRPIEARVPGGIMQARFVELFGRSFSAKKNVKFVEATRKAVGDANWKRTCALWKEAVKMAKERIKAHQAERYDLL